MLKQFEDKMQKSLDSMANDFMTIRAGRANPHVLDKVKVDYYGVATPVAQVGNVSVPEARTIMIQPWEPNLLKEIEKAILVSDIGITPTNDGKAIRLNFPDLTEERRKELAKDVKKRGEALLKAEADFNLWMDIYPESEPWQERLKIQKAHDEVMDKIGLNSKNTR